MKTLVVAALAALLCTAATSARADEAKKPVPAPAAEPAAAKPDAQKAKAGAKADGKAAEKKGDAAAGDAAKSDGKAAEKPCEPVKPCSID